MNVAKQEQIINALLTYPTIRQAAAAVGVQESTIYAYLKRTEFKAKYNEAKSNYFAQSVSYMQSLIGKATQMLADILDDSKVPPTTHIMACRAVLEYSLKLTEQADILVRLERIEQIQSNRNE